MSFASVYPHYVTKVEKKGRTIAELHEVIFWLTGYDEATLHKIIADKTILRISLRMLRNSILMFPKLRASSVVAVWRKLKIL